MTTHASSPNFIVWELINEADRQLTSMKDDDDNCAKVASVVILTMAALESFLNSYFHVMAFHLKDRDPKFLNMVKIGKNNKNRFVSTTDKILTWTKKASSKSIDENSPEYKAYDEVRILRDKITHYKPDEIDWGVPGISFERNHNIGFYKSLTKETGIKSLQAILDLIGAIGSVAGHDKMTFLGHWTGRADRSKWHNPDILLLKSARAQGA